MNVKTLYTKIKSALKRFFSIDDSPHNIAAGCALGVFLGVVPGEGIATTLILASIFKLNKASATAGVLATNMWSTFVVMPVAAFFGARIFNTTSDELIANFQANYHLGFKYLLSKAVLVDFTMPLLIGFILISLLIATSTYALLYFSLKYQKVTLD